MRLALVDDGLFDEHRARGYHPERPERLVAARRALVTAQARGIRLERLAVRDAQPSELLRVHTEPYLELLERNNGLFAAIDDDTYLTPRSVAAAYRAAGGSLSLVDALLDPTGPDKGLAVLRPPGHHARPDRGMGFCLVNNVAVAAAHARARGVERVAIVDWDVHHGNGTEESFASDPNVLFVSVHQYPFYPGTGRAADVGREDGRGFTVNVPLSPAASNSTYQAVFQELVLPVLHRFEPKLILISAGFDAHARDPLAAMTLTHEGFGWMASQLSRVAAAHANGRVGVFLEGGYDLEGIETSLDATTSHLFETPSETSPTAHVLLDEHRAEIKEARRAASPFWPV